MTYGIDMHVLLYSTDHFIYGIIPPTHTHISRILITISYFDLNSSKWPSVKIKNKQINKLWSRNK